MTATERLLDEPGRCSGCGTTHYTRRELNLAADQRWLCYACLDKQRGTEPILPEGLHGRAPSAIAPRDTNREQSGKVQTPAGPSANSASGSE